MRLVLISDTHDQRLSDIPIGDVLIHCGDAFCGDDMASLRSDLAWIGALPHRWKLFVRGNHDLCLDWALRAHPPMVEKLLGAAGITLLRDSDVEIEGVKFHGIDWQSRVAIPRGVDVIISHEPCYGILDAGLGSPALGRVVLSARPRLFISGHVHGARGHVVRDGIHFYNATLESANAGAAVAASSHTVTLPTVSPWVVDL
jgi:predicted phosphohydrolase